MVSIMITLCSFNDTYVRTLHKSELPVMKQPDSEVISLPSVPRCCNTDPHLTRSLKWITSKIPSEVKIPQGSAFIHLQIIFLTFKRISMH